MAAIEKYGRDRYRIRFYDHRNDRRTITVGKIPKRAAQSAAGHIQALVNARKGGLEPDSPAVKWAGNQSPRIIDALAELELITGRSKKEPEKEIPTLSDWFTSYIEKRKGADSSKRIWTQARKKAEEHFGRSRPIDQITVGEALEWYESMQKDLAEATCRKTISISRQVFKRAVKSGILTVNPFNDDELPVAIGAKEKPYIDVRLIEQVLKILSSAEWRAVVVLARYGGLRVQSEVPGMKWSDIDWDNNRFAFYSPKTKTVRQVPLFPSIREALEELQPITGEGEYVLRALRTKSKNWRTPLEKMLKRAGIQPWPAMFNSLRSSAAIDVCREYGMAAVVEWIGHSEAVSLKHYQRTIDSDFQRAAELGLGHTQKHGPRYGPTVTESKRNETKVDAIAKNANSEDACETNKKRAPVEKTEARLLHPEGFETDSQDVDNSRESGASSEKVENHGPRYGPFGEFGESVARLNQILRSDFAFSETTIADVHSAIRQAGLSLIADNAAQPCQAGGQ